MKATAFRPNWFVALPVPAEAWLQSLANTAPDEVKMFVPGDVHLTISFFGTMHPAKKLDVIQFMSGIAFDPFVISFARLRPLPTEKFPTALSFELVKGREEAAHIMEQWRDPLSDLAGAKRETRPPLPHVTIARPHRQHGAAGRRAALAWAAGVEPPAGEVPINSIALYTWSVDRHKRQFDIVYEHTIHGKGAP